MKNIIFLKLLIKELDRGWGEKKTKKFKSKREEKKEKKICK